MHGKDSPHLTTQQQRVLRLLFKFRFASTGSLATVMGIRRYSVYETLEHLVKQELVTKIYEPTFRIERRPAHYYLSKRGVTIVRKLMNVRESVVHTLYKNNEATDDFVRHCIQLAQCYVALRDQLPKGSELFTKAEINRFSEFPKNRPDLYIRTPSQQEAMIVIVSDTQFYIVRKRLIELITHSEDEGWNGTYPHICFVVRDTTALQSFLRIARKTLDDLGIEEDELPIRATSISTLTEGSPPFWSTPNHPKNTVSLFKS